MPNVGYCAAWGLLVATFITFVLCWPYEVGTIGDYVP